MKNLGKASLFLFLSLGASGLLAGQDDETRQGTGLPTMIGENAGRGNRMNVSGRIVLEGADKLVRRPVITVTILLSGAATDRTTTNDTGFFVIRNVPRENATILVEVDGVEVARQPIISSPMGNPRVDVTIPWPANIETKKPGVISVDSAFERNAKDQALFEQAMAATRAKDSTRAIELFTQLLIALPGDYVSWTELGTVYFKENSLDNAEGAYYKAIELKRDYFIALLNLGKLYISNKQLDNAVLVLSNAVKSKPESADAHQFIGEAYLQSKKGTSAAYHFNEAIKLAPTEKAELHLRLASLYDAANQKGKASSEYKMFLQKQPEYAEKARLEKYIADNPIK